MTNATTRGSGATSPDVILFPSDRAWADARRGARLAETQRPPAIALPRSVDELVDVVAYATTVGLRVVVTGAGGDAHGRLDGALLVDVRRLSKLKRSVPHGHAATSASVAVC